MLGLAVLYAAHDEEVDMPEDLRTRIKDAYAQLGLEEEKPVRKVRIHVYRINDAVFIDELGKENNNPPGAGAGIGQVNNDAIQTLIARMNRLEQLQTENHHQSLAAINNARQTFIMKFNQIRNNMRRYGETMPGALARLAAHQQQQQPN